MHDLFQSCAFSPDPPASAAAPEKQFAEKREGVRGSGPKAVLSMGMREEQRKGGRFHEKPDEMGSLRDDEQMGSL